MGKCYYCYESNQTLYVRDGKQLKVCVSCYEQHYAPFCKSKEEQKLSIKNAEKRQRVKRQKFIMNHLKENPCIDCGGTNILTLEYDHRSPELKYDNIATLVARGSIRKLKEELKKCDVVCANCHRIRTAKMFGSWRLKHLEEVK